MPFHDRSAFHTSGGIAVVEIEHSGERLLLLDELVQSSTRDEHLYHGALTKPALALLSSSAYTDDDGDEGGGDGYSYDDKSASEYRKPPLSRDQWSAKRAESTVVESAGEWQEYSDPQGPHAHG